MINKIILSGVLLTIMVVMYVFTHSRDNSSKNESVASDSSSYETTSTQTNDVELVENTLIDSKKNMSTATVSGDAPDAVHTDVTGSSDFDPNANYTYSSAKLTNAINGLEKLNESRKNNNNITEDAVLNVWKQVDAAVAEDTMSSIEGMKHKQWLASLVDSPRLKQQFDAESNALANQLQVEAVKARQAQAKDPKFVEYKTQEKRLTKEILAKYPNDTTKAAHELEKALDEVRVQIYSQ